MAQSGGGRVDLDRTFRHTALGRGLADIRQVTVADGAGSGGRLLEVRTPSGLVADIALDRGGDLLRLAYLGREVGWHSPTAAPHPWPDPDAEHGLGFMRGFDGFMVTCGLDHHGLPAETSAQQMRYPPRAVNVHPLHGRIATQKAELCAKTIGWSEGLARIDLCVRQSSVFGETLQLTRRYTFALDAARIDIDDKVVNFGYRPARHGMLYHVNVGYPFLSSGARLTGERWSLRDRLNDGSAQPSDDHVEIVDAETSPSDGVVGLCAADGTRLQLTFDPAVLPVTALWRAFRSGIFALGLEPQTRLDDPAASVLYPGASRRYGLRVELN
ncbi:DUF4432 family protein [Oceaniglobus trochenteri]|uniref:DUF4432 family protein n=1 Tax=Oceaniglobus trochenteri TaxID=2763260 RepID=UPI001CFF69C8|nr:DUF4432 family protein [Oceaniglobus trochenteri]